VKDKITIPLTNVLGGSVTLTRQEIEKAVRDLNEPEFTGGDIVEWTDMGGGRSKHVVLYSWERNNAVQRYGGPVSDRIWVTSGGEVSQAPIAHLKKVGSLNG